MVESSNKHEIIERSGTKFNSGVDMELALRDAETRLQRWWFVWKGVEFRYLGEGLVKMIQPLLLVCQ